MGVGGFMEKVDLNIIKTFAGSEEQDAKKLADIFEIIFNDACVNNIDK